MSKKINLFKSTATDYSFYLSEKKIKEYEAKDPPSKNLLKQKLCDINSGRTALFSAIFAVFSMFFSVIVLLDINADTIRESVFLLVGLLLTAVGGLCCAVIIYRELNKRKTVIKKAESAVFIYWALFSMGSALIIAADFSIGSFAFRFCFYTLIMIIFPLFDLKRRLFIIIPYLSAVFILGAIFKASAEIYVISVVLTLAYLIISSMLYISFCRLFFSNRQLSDAVERCKQMNEKDASTGLLNKKGLIKRLNEIKEKNDGRNIAAIFFDIDDFRRYNHLYTDSESDECLYNISNCVRIVAKAKTDIISRYGGDEFVIIVQDTAEYDLIYFAEQIRKNVERMAISFENEKKVTVTIGVSSIVEGGLKDYSAMIKEAEDNLVLAKKGGKNCVGYMGNVFKAH